MVVRLLVFLLRSFLLSSMFLFLLLFVFFFFFQAEDGIRDRDVTGVQTCALPISLRLLHEIRKDGPGAPVIFLSDHVDQIAVDAAIKAGASDCLQTSNLNESSIARAIRYAIDVYCKERQRQKAEDTVRKLWRAVEQSADLVIITERGGVIEYVNPAFEALTGYSREESVGRTPRILKSDQQTANLYQELWETILAGNVFRGVLVNRKKNGQIFYAEKTITPLRDADGAITHFISNDRDITERRRLESQLQQAQKMDAIGRLAGGVAHDFNNLLMVISAYAELMLDSLGSEHPLRRNVQEIMTASRRAADLTRAIARLWPQADAISAASGLESGNSRNK